MDGRSGGHRVTPASSPLKAPALGTTRVFPVKPQHANREQHGRARGLDDVPGWGKGYASFKECLRTC